MTQPQDRRSSLAVGRVCLECSAPLAGKQTMYCSARCKAAYSRRDPDTAARDRATSHQWKVRNREANRARDRARAADERRRGRCQDCGGLMGVGRVEDGVCRACQHIVRMARAAEIERMWKRGDEQPMIAREVEMTTGSLRVEMNRLRIEGLADLPLRRSGRRKAGEPARWAA